MSIHPQHLYLPIPAVDLRPSPARTCLICGKILPRKQYRYCHGDCQRRAAKLRQARRGDSIEIRKLVFRRDRGVCAMCRKSCKWGEWEADHVVPIAAGGASNNPDNLRTLCVPHHREVTSRWRASFPHWSRRRPIISFPSGPMP